MTTTFLLSQLLIKLDGPKLFLGLYLGYLFFVFCISAISHLWIYWVREFIIFHQKILSLVPVKTELVHGFCFLSSSRSILVADKIGDSPIKSDIKLGPQVHLRVPSPKGTIQLVQKPRKMELIIPPCRRETWEGVCVETWCTA